MSDPARTAVFHALVALAEAETYHDPDRFLAELARHGFQVVTVTHAAKAAAWDQRSAMISRLVNFG